MANEELKRVTIYTSLGAVVAFAAVAFAVFKVVAFIAWLRSV